MPQRTKSSLIHKLERSVNFDCAFQRPGDGTVVRVHRMDSLDQLALSLSSAQLVMDVNSPNNQHTSVQFDLSPDL